MDVKKVKLILVRVLVTFVEGAGAYFAVNGWDFNSKTVVAGAVAAGLSALYNWARHYYPEIFSFGVTK